MATNNSPIISRRNGISVGHSSPLANLGLWVSNVEIRHAAVIPVNRDHCRARIPRDAGDEHIQRINDLATVGKRHAYLGGFLRRGVCESDELGSSESGTNVWDAPGFRPTNRAEVEFVEDDRRNE